MHLDLFLDGLAHDASGDVHERIVIILVVVSVSEQNGFGNTAVACRSASQRLSCATSPAGRLSFRSMGAITDFAPVIFTAEQSTPDSKLRFLIGVEFS